MYKLRKRFCRINRDFASFRESAFGKWNILCNLKASKKHFSGRYGAIIKVIIIDSSLTTIPDLKICVYIQTVYCNR